MTDMPPLESWFKFLSEGQFRIQQSRSSGAYVFYPRILAPGTGENDLEWVEPSGRGFVYSTTVVRQRPPNADYNVAIVELDEGPRLMTRVEGLAPAEIRIGMRVRARVSRPSEGEAILVFDVETQP